ncbi:hypothetical protein [Kiloniella antarctica]|uniref:SnoaL-like domain-containing protein n=1 Tax=Kiloniella antarctica TaxID=1550907 RepID=A0ABW5BDG2_9PROT
MNAPLQEFEQAVKHQVELLEAGYILQALDLYFNEQGKMYENDNLFGKNRAECRSKQEPYINAAKEILGKITDLKIVNTAQICIFRNKSRFIDQQNNLIQIDGVHWQKWKNGKIIEERYYHAHKLDEILSQGLLNNPESLKKN